MSFFLIHKVIQLIVKGPSESSTPSTEYIENPNGFYEDDRSELGDSTESDDE